MRLASKHKLRQNYRYCLALLDYPNDLWPSFALRADNLNISLQELMAREAIINKAIDQQLASLDPELAAQGGNTGKPNPQRIERIFCQLKA